MPDIDTMVYSDEEDYDSDDELRDALSRGDLQPGLNMEVEDEKPKANNVKRLKERLQEIRLKLPWIERLDMVNNMAPLAPELAVQMEKHEQKRASLFAGNQKLPFIKPEDDPVLNDFKREILFHRQAQSAVIEGIKRLHSLGLPTKRPDDYFAEMAKSDEHMQKVRANLMAKQEGQQKSERLKQIRDQRRMGKMLQKQAKVQRETEKKDMLDQLKKFRKGKLKNLDFLDDEKKAGGGAGGAKSIKSKRSQGAAKRKARDAKFGFGGKKRGLKRNTKSSSMDSDGKGKKKNGGAASSGGVKRMGKSQRTKLKSNKGSGRGRK